MARTGFDAIVHSLCLLVLLIIHGNAATASWEAVVQREFDYFALALQWPGSYCQRTRHCCSSSACCLSNPLTEFTIHGLWPDYNDGNYPTCCRNSYFSIKKISSLLPELWKHWPSLTCSSPPLCHGGKGLFWAHEWEKHGTCSYPVLLDEYSYFLAALVLYFKYNVTRILSNEGIMPSNTQKYFVEDIISAIKKAVGALPLLECRRGSLEELQLCFDKKFQVREEGRKSFNQPRDCYLRSDVWDGKTLSSRKSCPESISFPIYTPLGSGLNGHDSATVSWLIMNEPFTPFNVV